LLTLSLLGLLSLSCTALGVLLSLLLSLLTLFSMTLLSSGALMLGSLPGLLGSLLSPMTCIFRLLPGLCVD